MAVAVQLTAQTPTALWGKAVQGTQGTKVTSQGADIKLAADGGLYISGAAGTKTVDDIIRFGNDQIATPETEYMGNGDTGTQNLFIMKVTADGTPQWTVYSKNGHALSGSALMQPVSDGLLVVFGIQHPTKLLTRSVVLVDAAGHVTDLGWSLAADAKNYHRLVVLKLDASGALQWMRQVEPDYSSKTEGFGLYGLAVDGSGNIFVAGRQFVDLTWTKADGTTAVVQASGADADMMLVKLDKDGYYLGHLKPEGMLNSSNVRAMQYADGKFYLMGIMEGTANTTVTLGGKELTLANAYETAYLAAVGSDLTVEWARLYDSKDRNFNMQQNSLLITQNAVWLAGMGAISVTTATNKDITLGADMSRQGTLLKFDKTNGTLTDGYLKPLFQTGYFSMFEGEDGNIYAAGYAGVLTGRRTTAGGLYIDRFNPDDLSAAADSWEDLIQTMGSGQRIVCDADGHLFTLTRTNVIDNALVGSSQKIVQDYAGYCASVCAFQLPVKPAVSSGIRSIKTDGQRESDGAWYTLGGQRVSQPTAKGIYIHHGRKVVVK